MEKKKVIIIGAGPAGLTAAYELIKNEGKYEVTILEASDSIGGISKTVHYKDYRMDIGGHRFFSKDKRIMDFWRKLMPIQGVNSFDDEKLGRKKDLEENGPNPNKCDDVMLVRTRVSRIYAFQKFFDYPISMKFETFKNMGLARTIKAGLSYLKASLFKRKEVTLEDFFINHFGKTLYQIFFESYTERLWGRHPRDIDASWGAQRVKGVSISAIIKDMFNKLFGKKNNNNSETSLIEQFWYPKYGPRTSMGNLSKKNRRKRCKCIKKT